MQLNLFMLFHYSVEIMIQKSFFVQLLKQQLEGMCHPSSIFSSLCFLFSIKSYVSYKIHRELTDLKAPSNAHEPTRIQLQENKIQFGSYASLPASDQPIDISLMYKEILQCENIIERLDKILGFIKDENQSPVPTMESNDKGIVSHRHCLSFLFSIEIIECI